MSIENLGTQLSISLNIALCILVMQPVIVLLILAFFFLSDCYWKIQIKKKKEIRSLITLIMEFVESRKWVIKGFDKWDYK